MEGVGATVTLGVVLAVARAQSHVWILGLGSDERRLSYKIVGFENKSFGGFTKRKKGQNGKRVVCTPEKEWSAH